MPQSLAQSRVVDPILSNLALGYRNAEFVGDAVCPRVPVDVAGGQVLQFGKEAFVNYNLRRAPGGRTVRLDFGYAGKPYALLQDAVEFKVPMENMREAALVPGIDLAGRAINNGMRVVLLSLEIEQAGLVRAAGTYAAAHKEVLAAAARWTDPASDPEQDVLDAREVVRRAIGVYPNQLTIGATVFAALVVHPKIKANVSSDRDKIVTEDDLARTFRVERVNVGKGVYLPDIDADPVDIWGDDAILHYTPRASAGQEEPSFAYTYVLRGHPAVEIPYSDRNAKSWLYPTTFERAPVLACPEAGFLFQSAG